MGISAGWRGALLSAIAGTKWGLRHEAQQHFGMSNGRAVTRLCLSRAGS